MLSIKHLFHSAKGDGTDSSLVRPSNWNDLHDVQASTDGVVIGRAPGTGAGPMDEMPVSAMFPPGFVGTTAGTVAPTGWLMCDGSIQVRATYPALFGVIGTSYNTSGETALQFRLPDCRGRVIAMLDGGVGRLNNVIISNPNVVGGVGGAQAQSVSVHSTGTNNLNFGSPGFNFTGASARVAGESGGGMQFGGSGQFVQAGDAVAVDAVSGYTNINGNFGIAVDGTVGMYTVQPTIMMNHMIKT
jgi:hypothetical protein